MAFTNHNNKNNNNSNNSYNVSGAQTQPLSSKLRIIFWNARSVVSKREEIEKILENLDILICVESWLTERIKFEYKGFNTYRKDRNPGLNERGGGIVLLIRKSYEYSEIKNNQITNNKKIELCGVKILNVEKPFNIFCCYNPPNNNLSEKEWDMIVSNAQAGGESILLGDFNSHSELWNCRNTDTNGERLFDSINKYNLFLHNTNTFTRIDMSRNQKSNIDLIISTMDVAQFINCKVTDDTIGSDHFPIQIEINVEKSIYYKKTFKIQSKRTNWEEFQTILDSEFSQFFTGEYDEMSPLEKYDLFIEVITKSVKLCTPKKRAFNKKKYRNPVPWWDNECDKLKRLRQAAFKKWDYSKKIDDLIEFKKKRATAKKTFRKKKGNTFENSLRL